MFLKIVPALDRDKEDGFNKTTLLFNWTAIKL